MQLLDEVIRFLLSLANNTLLMLALGVLAVLILARLEWESIHLYRRISLMTPTEIEKLVEERITTPFHRPLKCHHIYRAYANVAVAPSYATKHKFRFAPNGIKAKGYPPQIEKSLGYTTRGEKSLYG